MPVENDSITHYNNWNYKYLLAHKLKTIEWGWIHLMNLIFEIYRSEFLKAEKNKNF